MINDPKIIGWSSSGSSAIVRGGPDVGGDGSQTRSGPLLSDGTPLRDLIDFERREVSIRVLNDPEIHRIELDRIFARSWIALAHESEIPNPGDYVLRSVGEDGVIITHDANGKVNALLNVCTHRGMEVCWGSVGNSTTFRCGYHGWIFDNEGNLRGVPLEQEMYGDWDKSEYGLQRARRRDQPRNDLRELRRRRDAARRVPRRDDLLPRADVRRYGVGAAWSAVASRHRGQLEGGGRSELGRCLPLRRRPSSLRRDGLGPRSRACRNVRHRQDHVPGQRASPVLDGHGGDGCGTKR